MALTSDRAWPIPLIYCIARRTKTHSVDESDFALQRSDEQWLVPRRHLLTLVSIRQPLFILY